jgi:hypothetical protein
MGRLTLNVLLSFAQFEREVIGERVRDKIAASKQKGLWVGGPIPLGYRSEKKQLVAVEEEAVLVRRIFHLYRDLGSVGAVVEALDSDRVRARQGSRFRVGALAHLLKNRFYLGEIIWRGEIHRGEHAPIVDATIFTEVQQRLTAAAILRKGRAANRAFILAGLLHDDAGNRMSPSHARKNGVRYRYYVSQALLQHRKADAGSIARVSAPEIEAAVTAVVPLSPLYEHVTRITLHRDRIVIEQNARGPDNQDAARTEPITIPFAWQPQGRRKGIAHEPTQRPNIDPAAAQGLLAGIGRARSWMGEIIDGSATIVTIAARENLVERHVRRLLPLACLSPTIIRAIADGSAPAGLTINTLTAALPQSWATQEQRFLAQ